MGGPDEAPQRAFRSMNNRENGRRYLADNVRQARIGPAFALWCRAWCAARLPCLPRKLFSGGRTAPSLAYSFTAPSHGNLVVPCSSTARKF